MDWAAMLLYIVVTCITPGPNNLMSLYLSANYGLAGARKYITASAASFFVKLLLCGALNVMLASVIPALIPYLKWLGAAYMLYLAYSMLRSGFAAQNAQKEQTGESTYRQGILLQCLNIKSWVCNLSVYSVYVIAHSTAPSVILLVAVVNTACMLCATLCWGAFGSAFRRLYAAHRRAFSTVMALSLVYCAITALK